MRHLKFKTNATKKLIDLPIDALAYLLKLPKLETLAVLNEVIINYHIYIYILYFQLIKYQNYLNVCILMLDLLIQDNKERRTLWGFGC